MVRVRPRVRFPPQALLDEAQTPRKKSSKNDLFKKENVLGTKNNSKILNLPKIENDLGQVSQKILGETTSFFNQTKSNIASQASNTFSSFIYDTAIKPIIDQIEHLPKKQQEKIKERICR